VNFVYTELDDAAKRQD